LNDRFDTDVLIIGGGAAASRAAIEATDLGAKVILVDKGIFGHSGCSGEHAGWDMAAGYPFARDDTPDIHFKDTLKAGGYLNNQKLVRTFVKEVGERMLELERYGALYERDESGRVVVTEGSGHSKLRFIAPVQLVTLKEELRRRPIRILEETIVTQLLTLKGIVVGAIAIDIKSGNLLVLRAKSTVLATGGGGQLYGWSTVAARSTNPVEKTGDGFAMAYRIGAELVDMENVQFLMGVMHPPQMVGMILSVADQRGYLLDGNGLAYAADIPRPEWNRARAIKEILSIVARGRGTPHGGVWLDTPRAFKEWQEKGYVWHFLRLQVLVDQLNAVGFDATKEMIEISPTCHHSNGGVVINERCETSVVGLFACGEVVGGIHGANRLGSNALPATQVFGKRAGEQAAKRAFEINCLPEVDMIQVEAEKSRLLNLLQKDGDLRPHEVRHRLQRLAWDKLSPIRNKKDLNYALDEIMIIKEKELKRIYVAQKSGTYNREWVEAIETHNLVYLAEMIAQAALIREESRQSHQRSDYPETDNEKWLVNICINQVNGEMKILQRPIVATELKSKQIRSGEN